MRAIMAGNPGDDGLASALDRALLHARAWAGSVPTRRVPAAGTAQAAAIRLGLELPAVGLPPAEVVDRRYRGDARGDGPARQLPARLGGRRPARIGARALAAREACRSGRPWRPWAPTACEIMPSASVWHGRTVVRFSVSSFRTGPAEVRDTLAALARAAAAVPVGA
jgi:hypothetical protein